MGEVQRWPITHRCTSRTAGLPKEAPANFTPSSAQLKTASVRGSEITVPSGIFSTAIANLSK